MLFRVDFHENSLAFQNYRVSFANSACIPQILTSIPAQIERKVIDIEVLLFFFSKLGSEHRYGPARVAAIRKFTEWGI